MVLLWSLYLIGLSYSQVTEFDKNLLSVIDSGQAVLVSFYAPWCGHCQQLAPTWNKVGEKLKESKIVVGKLDCTQHQDIASKYAVRGFPTIKIFRGGRAIDYEGARDESTIVHWAKRATGPSVISTKNKLDDLITKHQSTPIFLYNGNSNTQTWETFQAVAEKFVPNIAFYKNKTIDKNALDNERISVIKDGSEYIFNGVLDSLQKWVNDERESSFAPLTMKLARQYSKEDKYMAVVVGEEENEDYHHIHVVKSVALDRSSLITKVSFTSATSKMSQRTIDHLTYRQCESGELIVLPQGEHSGQYYLKILDDEVTEDDIRNFIEDIKSGKAQLIGKSAIGRVISDFVFGFYRLFKENPVLGGLIIGLPTILISFVIWGVCFVPEGNFNEYEDSGSGSDADVSSNEDNDDNEELEPHPINSKGDILLQTNIRRRQIADGQSSDEEDESDHDTRQKKE